MSVLPAGFGSGAGATPSYQIGNSLRMRAWVNASLSRTFATAGNGTTWTWAGWVKRGALSTDQQLFCKNPGATYHTCAFYAASAPVNALNLQWYANPGLFYSLFTEALFTDSSAWYHIVIVWDTSNVTAGDRWRIFVNGRRESLTGTYPAQGTVGILNTAGVHTIGSLNSGIGQNFDGYLADQYFIDGQALDPSDFGQFDSNSVWTPKAYSGTYGTNGHYLEFNDGSNVTNLCLDRSGNGNNWTPANISVSPGPTYDWMTDTPTDNYAVLSALPRMTYGSTLRDANLTASSADRAEALGSFPVNTGKWYAECVYSAMLAGSDHIIGVQSLRVYTSASTISPIRTVSSVGYNDLGGTSSKVVDNVFSSYGSTWGVGDIIGVALDITSGAIEFFRNGVSQGSIAYAFASAAPWVFGNGIGGNAGTRTFSWNFGQRPFAYTPPTGFLAMRTSNLPSVPVPDGGAQFDVALYTGNQTARSITGFAFRPDLVWLKARSTNLRGHTLFDVNRGATKYLVSNSTSQEVTVAQSLTSFNSDGFSLGTAVDANESGQTFVGWAWKANGAPVTNTVGTISSQVSANTTAGFSVVTYTGTGANGTVGHGLSGALTFLIVKRVEANGFSWIVWANSFLSSEYIILESGNAKATDVTAWNNTSPTSTVFSLGTNTTPNTSGGTYIAYCFATIRGFSRFGSYVGNGNADGPYVFCGFRPRYVLIKCSSAGGTSWVVKDTARSPWNIAVANLYPNLINAEDTTAALAIDTISSGFKIRGADGLINGNTNTYIFMAFAENPFGGSNVSPVTAR